MSRSFRKTPLIGQTKCESEKQDKRKANRLFRRISKIATNNYGHLPVHVKEVSDVWKFGKDGTKYALGGKNLRW